LLAGDKGYNDKEYFEMSSRVNQHNLYTTKRGPSLAVTFRNTKIQDHEGTARDL